MTNWAIAQDSSLLWKISGNGLEKESYLFGTIHIICKEDFLMDDRITSAFDQSEELIMELDMSDPQLPVKMQQVSLNPGMKNLQSELSDTTAKALNDFLTTNYGVGLAQLGILKPLVLSSMVMVKLLPCAEVESYEGFFTQRATVASKPIAGLETVEFQMGMFDQIPQSVQLEELSKMLAGEDSKKELEKLVQTYKSENIHTLHDEMNSSGMMSEYQGLMLDDRNKNWIGKIEEAMRAKPVFVAVGAGHLGGELGVISLLKNAGYTVVPVR
jgi:uncharacterized protein YbaP (TraB family)